MRLLLTLWRRELLAYFFSPMAYVVMLLFLVLMGLSFWTLITILAEGPSSAGVMRVLFGESLFFWLAMLLVTPVITMRLFAEEKRLGTIETLMTAPVDDVHIVLSKYLGALTFFIVIWIPTIVYPVLLARLNPHDAPVDWGGMAATYVGVGCVGALYLAVGLFASAITRNQAVAAMTSFSLVCGLFFAGFIPYFARSPGWQEFGRYISSVIHMMEFSRGVVDTRPMVFHLLCALFMLFVTVKVVESRKWRS